MSEGEQRGTLQPRTGWPTSSWTFGRLPIGEAQGQ
jgi:hypothetical protein